MRWEALFSDLEAQFAAADHTSLAIEVAERVRMDQSALRLSDRLRGQLGASITARARSARDFTGPLLSVGSDWLVLESGGRSVLVPFAAIVQLQGLGPFSAPARSVGERKLGLASALRALSRDRTGVELHLLDSGWAAGLNGMIDRVGRDFLEFAVVPLDEHRRSRSVVEVLTVPLHAVAAVVSAEPGVG